jgi:hypothetical protein
MNNLSKFFENNKINSIQIYNNLYLNETMLKN